MITNSEAPISISTTAYYKGFSMIITKRDPDVKHDRLLDEQLAMIDDLIRRGVKPSWNDETNKAHLQTAVGSQTKDDEVPHPAEQVKVAKSDLGFCKNCGAEMVRNPKTDKIFCKDKCWLK